MTDEIEDWSLARWVSFAAHYRNWQPYNPEFLWREMDACVFIFNRRWDNTLTVEEDGLMRKIRVKFND